MNFFENLPENIPEAVVSEIGGSETVSIKRVVFKGHSSAPGFWYDQEENEWCILLRGQGRLEFDDGCTFEMKPGDYLEIPAHQKHRVGWTAPDRETIWLMVFY